MRLVVASSSFPTFPHEAVNAGVFVWAIAEALANQGHDIWVFTPDKGEPIQGFSVPVETFRWGGSEKVLTRMKPTHLPDLYHLGRLMLQGRWSLAQLVDQVQAQAVLAMWAIPSGYWAAGGGVPFAVWALGSDIWGARHYPLGRQIVRYVLRSAGHVFADGYNLIRDIQLLANQSAEFLGSARNLPVASVPPASLGPGGPHFLFIGRWDAAKGPDILLEAMALLQKQLPDARLHMFGGGEMKQAIRNRVAQPDLREVVRLHGYADPATATAYLKACDALVIPSRIESIPVIFSDAMACSCPVVTTAVGDLEQLVCENKVGLVCPPEDPQALAQAMGSILAGDESPRIRHGAAIRRTAGFFDPARSAERCAEVLASLIN